MEKVDESTSNSRQKFEGMASEHPSSSLSADKEATTTQPIHRFSFSSAAIANFVPGPLHEHRAFLASPVLQQQYGIDLFNLSDLNRPYSEETQAKHEAIMAQLISSHDIFDSVAWDPDLGSLSPLDKSPEPVEIIPQPVAVAYTTVGSVVNLRATPQLTAPNRIQREGAQRKSLMSILQTYDANSLNNQHRGPPPPLNMSNSMHYAQQLGRRTPQKSNALQQITNRAPRTTLPNLPDISTMSEEDLRRLIYSLGHRLLGENGAPFNLNVKGMAEEELATRSGTSSGSIQGLEKMQTVQRLSKFPNPMQKFAQNRLSEFSVARTQQLPMSIAVPYTGDMRSGKSKIISDEITTTPHPLMPKPGARLGDVATAKVIRQIEAAGGLSAYLSPYHGGLKLPSPSALKFNGLLRSQGELNREYQFPPPGLAGSSATQANPLYCVDRSSTQSTSIPTRPTGYPQPLTAGPPGQRQYPAAASFASSAAGTEGFWSSEFVAHSHNPLHNDPEFHPATNSPWTNSFNASSQNFSVFSDSFSKPGVEYLASTKVVDTISPQDAFKYYPNGFPADMTGQWVSPSEEYLNKFGGFRPLTPEESVTTKLEEIDDNFYHGYRRLASMTYEDYEAEFHARQINPYSPIARPPKVGLPRRSVEEWDKMTEQEEAIAMKPILTCAYGTLVAYLDKMPGGRFALSQWREAEEELIDRSKDGNKSYFGEDWGAPPKNPGVGIASLAALENTRATNSKPDPNSTSQILAAKHLQQR